MLQFKFEDGTIKLVEVNKRWLCSKTYYNNQARRWTSEFESVNGIHVIHLSIDDNDGSFLWKMRIIHLKKPQKFNELNGNVVSIEAAIEAINNEMAKTA